MKLIEFEEKNLDEGVDTIVRSGSVVWKEERGVFLVDEECIKALNDKNVPYHVLDRAALVSTGEGS